MLRYRYHVMVVLDRPASSTELSSVLTRIVYPRSPQAASSVGRQHNTRLPEVAMPYMHVNRNEPSQSKRVTQLNTRQQSPTRRNML